MQYLSISVVTCLKWSSLYLRRVSPWGDIEQDIVQAWRSSLLKAGHRGCSKMVERLSEVTKHLHPDFWSSSS